MFMQLTRDLFAIAKFLWWLLQSVSIDWVLRLAAEDRRTRRHNQPNPPTTGPRCPQCSRICASEFGLRSHLRSHVTPSSTNVIVELDELLQASKQVSFFMTHVLWLTLYCVRKKVNNCKPLYTVHSHNSGKECRILVKFCCNNATSNCKQSAKFQ